MSFSSPRIARASGAPAPAALAAAWLLDELPLDGHQVVTVSDAAADRIAELRATEEAIQSAAEEAYARGLADGAAAARAETHAQLASATAALGEAAAAVGHNARRWVDNAEEHVAALAVAIARQLIEREIATDATIVQDLVRHALAEFPIDQALVVRVNPIDLALLTDAESEGMQPLGRRELTFHADPRVGRGGCLVEGRDRIIDGRVDTGLERVYRRLVAVGA